MALRTSNPERRVSILPRKSSVWIKERPERNFPKDFIFGAATAAYQVEGAWNSADKGLSIWDWLTHNKPNLILDGSSGDVACDSYHNFREDVKLLVDLGVSHYRFSISWPRLLPDGFSNKISQDGLSYYNSLIDELLRNNIEPVVTIHHWDLPHCFQELGGWTNPIIADYLVDFARVAFEHFGDRVKTWLTLNEPFIFSTMGYGKTELAPAMNFRGVAEYLAGHTMLLAHAKVYRLYQSEYKRRQNGRVGLTLYSCWNHAATDSDADKEAAETFQQFELGWFAHPIFSKEGDYPKVMKERVAKRSAEQGFARSRLPTFTQEEIELIRGSSDFFGLNHYTTQLTRADKDPGYPVPSYEDDIGVTTYMDASWNGGNLSYMKTVPWGFRRLLNWIKTKYDNPQVIVFENGYSDEGTVNDVERVAFYREYLNAVLDAIDDGCNISAFFAWSLLDNFEWCCGYSKHFGLYHVDYNDPKKKRTPKESAYYYKYVVHHRRLE